MATRSNGRQDDGRPSDGYRCNLTNYRRYSWLKDGGFGLPTAVRFRVKFGLDLFNPGPA